VLLVLAACDDSQPRHHWCDLCGVGSDAGRAICSPLTQAGCQSGEKCSWIVDATDPQYVGHTGCVPDGAKHIGDTCIFGAAGAIGYDDCQRGGVCSTFGQPGTTGVCKQVCDNAGGDPACDATHVCVSYPLLFSTGSTSPAAGGLCDVACDPLADNDFDGSGSQMRSGSACGSDARVGCYGLPSGGTPPVTAFACMAERHYDLALRHRTECTDATGCTDDHFVYANSCNQGYLPLLTESSTNSTIVCVAMCAPADCYAGSCGSNDENRLGTAPHGCTSTDAVGNFGSDEECQYLWARELDEQGHLLRSPWSDRVGICLDHAAYGVPSCKDLPLHGSGGEPDAVSLGCVSTTTAGLP
jgi:hypothetical protein